MNILVNLPSGFFTDPDLASAWERVEALGTVKKTSHTAAADFLPDFAEADVVLMWTWPDVTEAMLQAATRLKFIGHIDLGQAAARPELAHGIPVSVSRGGFSPAVSEMALALILTGLRRLSDHHAAMRAGTEVWVDQYPDDIDRRERELTGRSVALIGFGGIGRRLAELLVPFHVDLRIVDPYASADSAQALGGRLVPLEEALSESEIVVICAASNRGTRQLLGASEIEMLRPNALFVNVSRAALVDMDALTARLGRGELTAMLDVFNREPLEADSPLRPLPNAYLTPHRAGGLMSSTERIVHRLIDDLEAFLEGRPRQYALTEAMVPGLDGG